MALEDDSDELLSRLFQRFSGSISRSNACSQSTKSRRSEGEFQTLAMTNFHDFTRELTATERALHPHTNEFSPSMEFARSPRKNLVLKYPTWDELEEIIRELYDLYERKDKVKLTLCEQEYANLLAQATVKTLTHACVNSDRGDLEAAGVRVKLLEIAVRPTAQWRKLAFTLFLNTSIASLTAILSSQEDSTLQAQQLEVNLFKLLREMLSKAVVMSTSENFNFHDKYYNQDWVEQAIGCLDFFVKKANGFFSCDRLRSLDEHTLLFFVVEASNCSSSGSEVEQKAMELVVATMYAFKVIPAKKPLGLNWQPTKDHTVWNCGLPIGAVEQYISLDLLLYHFYNSSVSRLQRLACMVLVDLVCDQFRRSGSREVINTAGLEQIWRSFVEWEDPSMGLKQIMLSPYISSSRVVKQLALSCSLVSEKQLTAFVNQFRLLTQIDVYFGVNPSLDKMVKAAMNPGNSNISEEFLGQIVKQMHSNRAVERFRGERWLAELLTYGHDDDIFSSYNSKATTEVGSVCKHPEEVLIRPKAASAVSNPAGEELEETFCFNEGGEISLAAQAKFWELISPFNPPKLRGSFARVLTLFVRRKLQLTPGKADATTIAEVNTCLSVLFDHQESDPGVLTTVMLLILDICQCELSYIDKRKQQSDSTASSSLNLEESTYDRVAWSDSLASRVLNGDVALDKALLRQFDTEFFLHVLTVLHTSSDSHSSCECRRVCCGVDESLVGDVAACTALILTHSLSDSSELEKLGGLAALTPFLQACDTRVAVFIAKLISETIKQADEAQYAAFLRELYVACVETDDESALYNSYLHAQTLLHNFDMSTSV